MEIPDQIKVRLFLSFEENIFRKFYWFEMKKDDFYWGSAYKGSNLMTTIEKADSVLINIPDDFDKLPKKSGKHSYHESGKVHFKTTDERQTHYDWISKKDIQKPVRFYAIISRAIEFYNKFETNLTKDNAHAMVLKFPSNATNKRIYFEFFLSPEGTFLEPETLIKTSDAKMNIATQTIGPNLILVIRYAVMANQKEQHLDKEIAILPDSFD